jgi:glycosyltransferase involved in cell wall biosynthesis
MKRNILVITHTTPIPDLDGASVRIVRLMQMLIELGWSVTNLSAGQGFHPVYQQRAAAARAFLTSQGIETPPPAPVTAYLAAHGARFDAIWLGVSGGPDFIPALRRAAPQAVIVFDTIELTFVSMARAAEVQGSARLAAQAQAVQASQLQMVAQADFTLVVTEEEQRVLAALTPAAAVRVISNVHVASDDELSIADRRDLLFVGNFVHRPNRDAAHYLVTTIWPRLRQALPGVRLQLVGLPTPEIEALAAADVQVVGHAPSLEPFFRRSRLSVAPLRFGAGIKGKVLESMAYGLPVVMTSIAAEGAHVESGIHALVADAPAAFTAAVVQLYQDDALWLRLAHQGRQLVHTHFGDAAVKARLAALLAEIW